MLWEPSTFRSEECYVSFDSKYIFLTLTNNSRYICMSLWNQYYILIQLYYYIIIDYYYAWISCGYIGISILGITVSIMSFKAKHMIKIDFVIGQYTMIMDNSTEGVTTCISLNLMIRRARDFFSIYHNYS